ncbi:MAG: carbonic anhydrase [Candidatus Acidiferrales bacterium]
MTSLLKDASSSLKLKATAPADELPSESATHAHVSDEVPSRRTFFKTTIGGAVAGLVTAAGVECLAPRRVMAQTALTPDAALKELMDGNGRFASGSLTSFEHDLAILRQHTVDKQEPFAAVLTCADSRVPVELIFDQTLGQIFVTRVAGNFAATEIIASLEYGAAVLGTKVIVVLAHSGCGAVKATIQAKDVPGQISSLFAYIRPAVDQAGANLEAASKANAKIQAGLLRQASTVISALVKENKVKVVAAYYDLATGTVSLLE